MLALPGAEARGVLGGVEFLRDVALGNPPELEPRVVVIGGGNVAYDVGRTVLRQISIDAARVAKRASGVSQVHLCSLESLEEMPADSRLEHFKVLRSHTQVAIPSTSTSRSTNGRERERERERERSTLTTGNWQPATGN